MWLGKVFEFARKMFNALRRTCASTVSVSNVCTRGVLSLSRMGNARNWSSSRVLSENYDQFLQSRLTGPLPDDSAPKKKKKKKKAPLNPGV